MHELHDVLPRYAISPRQIYRIRAVADNRSGSRDARDKFGNQRKTRRCP
jgi:hypothetical protein